MKDKAAEEHLLIDADDKYEKIKKSRPTLKQKHLLTILVVLFIGYLAFRHYANSPIKRMPGKVINVIGENEKIHSFDVSKFPKHKENQLPIKLSDMKPLRILQDPPGCPPLKSCDHVICDEATEYRTIQRTAEGCRDCVCIPKGSIKTEQ